MKTFFVLLILLSSIFAQAHFRIIGENDLITVQNDLSNVPSQFQKIVPAIGKFSPGCTVTHIGQGIVLTAGHCFWQTFFDTQLKLNQPCTGETVTWQITNQESKCLEIIAMQRHPELALDFAIVKISNPPKAVAEIDWVQKVLPGKVLTMFSYPEELPLSWSQYCPLKPLTSADVNLKYMHYVCDTEVGSSGAVVLDAKNGKVVGLHVSGDGEINPDGTKTVAVENFGIHIRQTPIKALLKRNGFLFNLTHKESP